MKDTLKPEEVKIDRRSLTSAANARKSRGPQTPEAKAASSRNNLRHGLLATHIVLDDESRENFAELAASLNDEFQPRTPSETALVENMTISRWRQMRLWSMEKAGLDHEIRKQADSLPEENAPTRTALAFRTLCDQSRSLDLINRYETRYDRQFSRAIQRLGDLRSKKNQILPFDPILEPGTGFGV